MSRVDHQRVKEIFLQSLDLQPDEIDDFLTKECGKDKSLRAEVEALLKHNNDKTIIDKSIEHKKVKKSFLKNDDADIPQSNHTGKFISNLFGNKLKRNIIVVSTVIFLCLTGYIIYNEIEDSFNQMVTEDLNLTINANARALEIWIEDWKSDAELVVRNKRIRAIVNQLTEISNQKSLDVNKLQKLTFHNELEEILDPYFTKKRLVGYTISNEAGVIISSSVPTVIGKKINPEFAAKHQKVFEGKTTFSKPFPAGRALSLNLEKYANSPLVFVHTPIYDDDGNIISSIGFGAFTPDNFSEILSVARIGGTGESYAFDRYGVLLSESRYENDLKEFNQLPDSCNYSALNIQIRNPEVKLRSGHKSKLEMAARPLTRLAALAIASRGKVNVEEQHGVILTKYKNYLGDEVVGAWKWMNKYDFGLAVEVTVNEVYKPLLYLDLVFGLIFIILVIVTGISLFSSFTIVRLRKKIGDLKQVGQFTLLKKIGEGGLGEVYLARHSLLKRPTAIKILKPNLISKETITRFEREVQLASQLRHPNTIEIYDFGFTDEGIFYYAMEYLPGYTLAEIIAKEGKFSVGRTAYILSKVCASLDEAHKSGLIHRDIKPQNLMLTTRLDEFDIVKVLDFGLVKDLTGDKSEHTTDMTRISGTLLYMSPERISSPFKVDITTDIYSIGATAYYMLTGQNAFDAETNMDIMYNVMNEDPRELKDLEKIYLPDELKSLIFECLAKEPKDRPRNVTDLIKVFESILQTNKWDQKDAENWWANNSTKIN